MPRSSSSSKNNNNKGGSTNNNKKTKDQVCTCYATNEKYYISTVTLSEIKKAEKTGISPKAVSNRKVLVRIPSQIERDKCYLDASNAMSILEQQALPSYGGRSWKVIVTIKEPKVSGKKKSPLFRWYRGNLELACLPHFLERIPDPPFKAKGKTMRESSKKKEEDLQDISAVDLQYRPVSTLSTIAWNNSSHIIPQISQIKYISPNHELFYSRKQAWEHSSQLIEQEALLDKFLLGYGSRGQMLKPFKPTKLQGLKVGKKRFLRDGLWIIGQEESWQSKRIKEIEDEEEERQRMKEEEEKKQQQAQMEKEEDDDECSISDDDDENKDEIENNNGHNEEDDEEGLQYYIQCKRDGYHTKKLMVLQTLASYNNCNDNNSNNDNNENTVNNNNCNINMNKPKPKQKSTISLGLIEDAKKNEGGEEECNNANNSYCNLTTKSSMPTSTTTSSTSTFSNGGDKHQQQQEEPISTFAGAADTTLPTTPMEEEEEEETKASSNNNPKTKEEEEEEERTNSNSDDNKRRCSRRRAIPKRFSDDDDGYYNNSKNKKNENDIIVNNNHHNVGSSKNKSISVTSNTTNNTNNNSNNNNIQIYTLNDAEEDLHKLWKHTLTTSQKKIWICKARQLQKDEKIRYLAKSRGPVDYYIRYRKHKYHQKRINELQKERCEQEDEQEQQQEEEESIEEEEEEEEEEGEQEEEEEDGEEAAAETDDEEEEEEEEEPIQFTLADATNELRLIWKEMSDTRKNKWKKRFQQNRQEFRKLELEEEEKQQQQQQGEEEEEVTDVVERRKEHVTTTDKTGAPITSSPGMLVDRVEFASKRPSMEKTVEGAAAATATALVSQAITTTTIGSVTLSSASSSTAPFTSKGLLSSSGSESFCINDNERMLSSASAVVAHHNDEDVTVVSPSPTIEDQPTNHQPNATTSNESTPFITEEKIQKAGAAAATTTKQPARPSSTTLSCPPRRINQSWYYNMKPNQIKLCNDAAMDHYHRVMHTVKARDLSRELADGFDVLRERGHGRFDMELPQFDQPEFDFLTNIEKSPWISVVREILGADVSLIHKGVFLSMPGAATQIYHQDGPHLTTKCQRPCHAVNVFIPLVDLHLRNGPTEFFLGTHILGHDEYDKELSFIPEVSAGTPIIFDYRLGHRGLGNSTSSCRPIVYCTYAAKNDGKEFRDSVNFSRKRYHKIGDDLLDLPLSREERAKKRRRSEENRRKTETTTDLSSLSQLSQANTMLE